jgi:hypothetical protein
MDWASIAPPRAPTPASPPPPVSSPKSIDPAEQLWAQVRNSSDPARLQEYLDKYPASPHGGEAQSLLENAIWSRTNRDDIASLRAYAGRFPRGPHAGEASSRIAELTWNAVDKKEEQALRNFIGQFPDSPNRPEAQRLLDQLGLDTERKKKGVEEQARIEAQKAGQGADRQGIAQALTQYKQAYETRNLAQLRAVYPTLAGKTLDSIRQTFGFADSIQLDLKPLGEPEISGDTATVAVERSLRQTAGKKALAPVHGAITIRLKRIGQKWVIDSIM